MHNLKELSELTKELKVLCVEDSKFILKQLTVFLSKIFKEVYSSSDGLDGMEKYKQYKPDIVFTDLTMPNMDGFEMIKKLREINPEVKIIIISAHSDTSNILEAINIGIFNFIAKPIDKSLLQDAIYNVINKPNDGKNTNCLNILNLLSLYKINVEFINHYRGVPIINDGYITSIDNNSITIDVPNMQRIAITKENITTIEIDAIKNMIEAKLEKIKDNGEIVLTNLTQYSSSPKHREQVRVETADEVKIVLHYRGSKLDTIVKDISLNSVALVLHKHELDLEIDTQIDVALGFKTHYKGGSEIMEHNEIVHTKGNIFRINNNGSDEEIIILFELNKSNKNTLKKYIYERELKLIAEFKDLKL